MQNKGYSMKITLSTWAKNNGYSYNGAYLKFKKGEIPNATQDHNGTIRIDMQEKSDFVNKESIIYARCSSSKQKDDLKRQVERLVNFSTNAGYVNQRIYKEIASGMNDDRLELNKLLTSELKGITIIVEHKDRLTRFGFKFIEAIVSQKGGKILVVNTFENEEQDLTNDLIAVVTSFCAKLYGKRRANRKTEQITEIIKEQE